MKKLSFIFIIIIALSLFTGCTNLINDENGKIQSEDIANKYIDGEYYLFSSKFDNDNKAAYMNLTVKNNIISGIDFNYIYKNGSLYINKKDSSDELTFYVNSLNTLVLQSQESIKNINQNYENIYSDYTKLLNESIEMAKTGKIKLSYINIDYTYTAKKTDYDNNGYNAELNVTYKDGLINNISYLKKNKQNELITSNNEFLKNFKDLNNINYQKYIQNIIDMSIEKENLVLSTNNLETDKEYNNLAKIINDKTQNFDYTKYNIFKNIGEKI